MALPFEDLREELKENAIELWGRIQESPAYNNLRERYETLTPNAQKAIIAVSVALVVLMLMMLPYSYFSSSSDTNDQYVANRDTIRKLLRAGRISNESINLPSTVDTDGLKSQITEMLGTYQLLPQQNGGVTDLDTDSLGPGMTAGKLKISGVGVRLKKLNLKQIIDIGYDLQGHNPNVKLAGIEMTASKPDPHYFDVLFKLVVYRLPAAMGGAGDSAAGQPGGRPHFRPPSEGQSDNQSGSETGQ